MSNRFKKAVIDDVTTCNINAHLQGKAQCGRDHTNFRNVFHMTSCAIDYDGATLMGCRLESHGNATKRRIYGMKGGFDESGGMQNLRARYRAG